MKNKNDKKNKQKRIDSAMRKFQKNLQKLNLGITINGVPIVTLLPEKRHKK